MLKRVSVISLAFCGLAAAADLSCALVPGWTQQGGPRSYVSDNLFEYMDGNAEGYLLYGFQNMRGITCEKSGATFVIDISDFGDADSAYGMFSNNRDPRQPMTKIGAGGQIVPRRAMFVKGKYYVEIAANPEGDYTVPLKQWTAALDKIVEGTTEPPAALAWFPADKLQSLRLVPESVLGLGALQRGYAAQYDFGKAFVAIEESPASAAEAMKKLRGRFSEAKPVEIADEGFLATDRYLGRLSMVRKGRYIIGYANVADGQDPAALAKSLAARVQ
jgi:hypothetical protein